MKSKENKEAIKAQVNDFLKNAVNQIRSGEDPYELNEYRKIFRKNVPFSLRSYFAAWILKYIAEGKPLPRIQSMDKGKYKDRTDRFSGKSFPKGEKRSVSDRVKPDFQESADTHENSRHEEKSGFENSHPVLPEEASSTLFISIGKNRRVFPRDIISLILQNVEMDRDHIGDIRILDNYSFVQVITEDAGKIIEALTDFEYRGKKLNVSYSRKKDDETGSVTEETGNPGYGETVRENENKSENS